MIHDATRCALGEGPLWHPGRAELFWCDILNHRLHASNRSWQCDTFVSAAGWVDDDTLLLASATALSRFDIRSGTLTPLLPLEADQPTTRSNDGRADPWGGFWIGTMGVKAEPRAGTIWRYHLGTLRPLFRNISISNAICFAPDGRTAYFADTPTQQIMRVALDAKGWPAAQPDCHIDLTGTDHFPDGAVVDAAGNLFNAQWGSGRVAVYAPDGQQIDTIPLPAAQTTCPAFGGPDLSTLFCTSAAHGRDGPTDGQTFAIRTRYTGQTEHRVILPPTPPLHLAK